jgi:hypothetical protein
MAPTMAAIFTCKAPSPFWKFLDPPRLLWWSKSVHFLHNTKKVPYTCMTTSLTSVHLNFQTIFDCKKYTYIISLFLFIFNNTVFNLPYKCYTHIQIYIPICTDKSNIKYINNVITNKNINFFIYTKAEREMWME